MRGAFSAPALEAGRHTVSGESIVMHRPTVLRLAGAVVALLVAAACSDVARTPTAPAARPSAGDLSASRTAKPEEVELLRGAVIHHTVEGAKAARGNARPTHSSNLYYHGGVGGIGVETAPKVY